METRSGVNLRILLIKRRSTDHHRSGLAIRHSLATMASSHGRMVPSSECTGPDGAMLQGHLLHRVFSCFALMEHCQLQAVRGWITVNCVEGAGFRAAERGRAALEVQILASADPSKFPDESDISARSKRSRSVSC